MKPVVIVGAGVAGLTCARALRRHGIPFLLIDADDRIGGRLKSDVVGGFVLDRGAQSYLTAYPTAKEQLDEEKLNLKRFDRGAYVIWDGEQHLINRDNPLPISGLISVADKLKLGKWTSDVQWMDQVDIDEMPDRTSSEYLASVGFSGEMIERFFRPMFSALLLDRSLETSCRHSVFIWKALTEGDMALPQYGMEEIPRQLGMTCGPAVLNLGSNVIEATGAEVKLASGETIEAEAVVLACDAANAATLSGKSIPVQFRSCITLYFTAPAPPVEGGWLILNGNMRGITNHVVPVSNVNPGPNAGNLVSATILGERSESDEQLADIVKSEMRLWFPHHDAEAWQLLRAYRLPHAVMAQPPGFCESLPANESGTDGLYFAGEYTTDGTIDGAIRSGLDCAELVLERLGAVVA